MQTLIVGLPSLNEADNIRDLTQNVDAGCKKYFPNCRCILLNVDCQSPDGTREVFLSTDTQCEKVSLTTERHAQGKGAALRLVFQYVLSSGADFGLCLDTDTKTLTAEWLEAFKAALATCDFATPRYLRHRFDGTITNMLCYPVICAVFGCDMRQPIGGDFAFSHKAAEAFLQQPWPSQAEKYGIDIFMSTTILKAGLRIVEVELPPKVHKPSLPKLPQMFSEVVATLLHQLPRKATAVTAEVAALPRVASALECHEPPELEVDPDQLRSTARTCLAANLECIAKTLPQGLMDVEATMATGELSCEEWVKVLCWALRTRHRSSDEDVVKVLQCLFFLRAASHCAQVCSMSNSEAEELVLLQRDQLIAAHAS
ncbi:unnamed protein product [Effrenium voratum]|nr:unnamed protein product [Effrenium voratum]